MHVMGCTTGLLRVLKNCTGTVLPLCIGTCDTEFSDVVDAGMARKKKRKQRTVEPSFVPATSDPQTTLHRAKRRRLSSSSSGGKTVASGFDVTSCVIII